MTAEWCWKRLKGVFNRKWNFFGKRWDESLLLFRLYTLMLVFLDAGFVNSYWISDAFWSKNRNILHFSQILTSITMWWIGGFASEICLQMELRLSYQWTKFGPIGLMGTYRINCDAGFLCFYMHKTTIWFWFIFFLYKLCKQWRLACVQHGRYAN